MAMTPFRWVSALLAASLIIAVMLLRDSSPRSEPLGTERKLDLIHNATSKQAGALGGRLRLASLLDSTRVAIGHSKDASPIRVFRDGGIPAEARAPLDSLAWRAVSAVRDSGQFGIDIVFLYDTLSSFHDVGVRRSGVTMDYVLPQRTGDRCTVIVRLGNDAAIRKQISGIYRTEAAAEQLLGPCAYYRAFGKPGQYVDAWLRNRGWAFAHDGSWSRPGLGEYVIFDYFGRPIDVRDWYVWEMQVAGARCAQGETDGCEHALLDRLRGDGLSYWYPMKPLEIWDGNVLYKPYRPLGQRGSSSETVFGRREPYLLADMVRSMGRARFAAFWTSNEPVPAAFEKAAGEPLGLWTSRWVAAQYGAVSGRGPGMTAWTGAISVLLLVLTIFIALRVSAHRQFA